MTRIVLSALLVATALAWSTPASSAATSEKCWVVVKKTGFDVECVTCATEEEIGAAVQKTNADNAERDKANKAARAEISKLKSKLAAKKGEIAKATDATEKGNLAQYIEDLQSQIDKKTEEIKPLTNCEAPRKFWKKKDADAFIEKVTKDAESAREAAAAREAKEKEAKDKEKAKSEAKSKDSTKSGDKPKADDAGTIKDKEEE